MKSLTPVEWLALQRSFFGKPKKGLELLQSGAVDFSSSNLEEAKKDFEILNRLQITLISYESPDYPQSLKEIYDPPLVLLAKGEWSWFAEKPWVAIVGARKATEFGREKAKEIAKDLVQEGFGIVSGLAYGIDASAHVGCVEAEGATWGVLGSGIDSFYPQRNFTLAEKMTKNGGYLSEFPFRSKPYASHFIQRNRIISGLSQAVIVIEATLRSGSLVTARYALEQGREVFVVMPPKDHVAYEGNKKLLDDGATPYESAEQVREVTEGLREACHTPSPLPLRGPLGKGEGRGEGDPLLSLLKKPQSLETLIQKMQRPAQTLLADLTILESKGLIKKIPGPLWQSS